MESLWKFKEVFMEIEGNSLKFKEGYGNSWKFIQEAYGNSWKFVRRLWKLMEIQRSL
jgi:hypothetical protein